MRSITHRSKPSPEPILHRATKRIRFSDAGGGGGCDDVSATRCSCSRALLQAVTDPKARSALHKKGSNRPSTASLARISDTAQSVRAPDTSNCRYRHPPAPWLQHPERPLYSTFIAGLCFLPINSSAEVLCFLNSGTRVAPRFCVLSQSEGPLVWQPRSISTPLAGVPWLPSLSASTV